MKKALKTNYKNSFPASRLRLATLVFLCFISVFTLQNAEAQTVPILTQATIDNLVAAGNTIGEINSFLSTPNLTQTVVNDLVSSNFSPDVLSNLTNGNFALDIASDLTGLNLSPDLITSIASGAVPQQLIDGFVSGAVSNQLLQDVIGGNISPATITELTGLNIPSGTIQDIVNGNFSPALVGDLLGVNVSPAILTDLVSANFSPEVLASLTDGTFALNLASDLAGITISPNLITDIANGVVPQELISSFVNGVVSDQLLQDVLSGNLSAATLTELTGLNLPTDALQNILDGNFSPSLVTDLLGVEISPEALLSTLDLGIPIGDIQGILNGDIPFDAIGNALGIPIPADLITSFIDGSFTPSALLELVGLDFSPDSIVDLLQGTLTGQLEGVLSNLGLDLNSITDLISGNLSPELISNLTGLIGSDILSSEALASLLNLSFDPATLLSGLQQILPLDDFLNLLSGPLEGILGEALSGVIEGVLGNVLGNVLGGALGGGGVRLSLEDPAHVAKLRRFLRENWIAAFMSMTEQFTVVMMHQVLAVGEFLDAKHQLETERIFQQLTAKAHKEYQPSAQMCRVGTNVRSLAATEEKAKTNARLLNMVMMRRDTLSANVTSAAGPDIDIEDRINQFRETYCDVNDNNAQLDGFCNTGGGDADRINKDIDYTRTVDGRYTLDINFTDDDLSDDEEDIIALSRNLFSHKTFTRIPERHLMQEFGKDDFQDTRSIHAIRSVARNSFSHLVGMRASGTAEVGPFMKNLILEMGVPDDEIDIFLGENPSYFAQMDVLTRKMYQNPEFFVNLYAKPANVKRTGVALQAIKLMHDRDRYEASLRREMLMSLILEVKLREHQSEVNNDLLNSLSTLFSDPIN